MDGQLNTYTSGCAHPDGVILAGDDDHNTGNHVVLLNVRTRQTVPLPDSNQVYQLNVGGDGGWVKLPSLPHTIWCPMLVCDDSYLYVLGGAGCKVCVKLAKDNRNVAGGVLVKNNTVLVMSPSHYMTLNTLKDTWITQEYRDIKVNRMKWKNVVLIKFLILLFCCLAVNKNKIIVEIPDDVLYM